MVIVEWWWWWLSLWLAHCDCHCHWFDCFKRTERNIDICRISWKVFAICPWMPNNFISKCNKHNQKKKLFTIHFLFETRTMCWFFFLSNVVWFGYIVIRVFDPILANTNDINYLYPCPSKTDASCDAKSLFLFLRLARGFFFPFIYSKFIDTESWIGQIMDLNYQKANEISGKTDKTQDSVFNPV